MVAPTGTRMEYGFCIARPLSTSIYVTAPTAFVALFVIVAVSPDKLAEQLAWSEDCIIDGHKGELTVLEVSVLPCRQIRVVPSHLQLADSLSSTAEHDVLAVVMIAPSVSVIRVFCTIV